MNGKPFDPDPAADAAPVDRKAISGALMASGFPFQIAVRDLLTGVGWRVVEEEFPWRDPSGRDEFLDMVGAAPENYQPVIATIECKKTLRESYIFLLPPRNQRPVERLTAIGSMVTATDTNPRMVLQIADYSADPESVEATYCVVSGANPSERLLERDAQKLIRGTEAFARSLRGGQTKAGSVLVESIFVPILVTNAPLYVAAFDPTRDVSLAHGMFSPQPPDAKPVEFVRFRKAFVSGAKRQPSERTVFVTNAESLRSFLSRVGRNLTNPGRDRTWQFE